jgi:hypothetical protein
MKITKSQLKNIIEEELSEVKASMMGTDWASFPEIEFGPGGKTELKDAVKELGQIILQLREMYERLPEDRQPKFQKLMLENILTLHEQLEAERQEKHMGMGMPVGKTAE